MVFALSRPLPATFTGRSRPFPAGIALTGGALTALCGSPLPAARLGRLALGRARGRQVPVYGGRAYDSNGYKPFAAPLPIIARKWDANITIFCVQVVLLLAGTASILAAS